MNFEIYTIGGIQYLTQVYQGVVTLLGDNVLQTYMKLAGAVGIIFGSIMILFSHRASHILRPMVTPLVVGSLLIGMKTDVTIVDTK